MVWTRFNLIIIMFKVAFTNFVAGNSTTESMGLRAISEKKLVVKCCFWVFQRAVL